MRKKCALYTLLFFLLLSGCSSNEMNDEGTVSTADLSEKSISASENTQEENILENNLNMNSSVGNNYVLSEDDLTWYIELWASNLEPIMTKDQLDDIEWDEKIRPYMEYDWIGDEHIDRLMASVNSWVMQLVDLNLDGQPEMLVSEYFCDMKEDYTHVFTIQDGEVVYCGKIIADAAYRDNEVFGDLNYLPSYYIDVYQNASGEYKYLSGDDFLMETHGYYQIYENNFDGNNISCEPLVAVGFAEDMDGNKNYQFVIGNWMEGEEKNYSTYEQVMEEYMKGYEKIDIDFTVSQYQVPAFAGELPEEQQEIVRKNIMAGFAQALGYLKEE